ncbi:MAG: ATP-binding protein [bacterium]
MPGILPPETALLQARDESGANQSALYFLDYPQFGSLLLRAATGETDQRKRCWRAHCSDAATIQAVREARGPFVLPGHAITGQAEEIVVVPLRGGDQTIGALVHCFLGNVERSFEELQGLAGRRANDWFYGWIEFLVAEQTRPLPALFHVAGAISSSLDLERVLLNVVEKATVLFRAKMSSLMLVSPKRRELELATAYGCSLEYLDKPNLPLDGSILGRVVKKNKLLQVYDVFQEPLYKHKAQAKKEGVVSLLAAPITFQDEVLGVLNIYSAAPRRWQRSEEDLLQTFAAHAAIAITNARVHGQIIAMEEQLQVSTKLASLGELAAGLAHEIRNPLAVINMLIHSWKSAPPAGEDFIRDVEVIAQKISDLNTLVSDLLNLAKPRPLDRRPVDLEQLVDRLLRLLRHRVNQQRVAIRKEIRVADKIIPADRERMEQAILNLLLNALDVTPEGKPLVIAIGREEECLTVEIRDSGPGIPPEQVNELFKAFRTSKPQGTGLGLPMTRRIVEEHQGTIRVSANHPTGAVFTILLPRRVPE